jgi:hypothetical protein
LFLNEKVTWLSMMTASNGMQTPYPLIGFYW